jgi:YfiH family protein
MLETTAPRRTERQAVPGRWLITIPLFSQGMSGAQHYFGTKTNPGPIPVRPGSPGRRVLKVKQVHGTEVLVVDRRITNWPAFEAETASSAYDAMVTTQPDLLLSITTADCVPLLLMDADRGVVAAAHAGWRGTLGGIAAKTIQIMQERFQCRPRSIRAAIGPSIGVCCYEVDAAVLTPLKKAYPYWEEVLDKTAGARAHLDLRRLNRRQMEEAGLDPARIETVNLCTACHSDLFHSYRRNGKGTGFMTSGIGLTAVLG